MAVDPADDCTFWYTNESHAVTDPGSWITQIGTFKFSSCYAAHCPVSYSDVPSTNPFYTWIFCESCKGIIGGYSDGTFQPFNYITRGALAKTIAASLFYSVHPTTQTFADIPPTSPFYWQVEALAHETAPAPIISGYTCGSSAQEPCDDQHRPYFRPNSYTTRGQIAKLVDGGHNTQAATTATPTPQHSNILLRMFHPATFSGRMWNVLSRSAVSMAIHAEDRVSPVMPKIGPTSDRGIILHADKSPRLPVTLSSHTVRQLEGGRCIQLLPPQPRRPTRCHLKRRIPLRLLAPLRYLQAHQPGKHQGELSPAQHRDRIHKDVFPKEHG